MGISKVAFYHTNSWLAVRYHFKSLEKDFLEKVKKLLYEYNHIYDKRTEWTKDKFLPPPPSLLKKKD